MDPKPLLSVLLPCLNEKPSLEGVIREIRQTCAALKIPYEIIVADNGSTDGSAQEATRLGARVVPVKKRGYGAAVNAGILAARGQWVVFGDADGSYPFCSLGQLLGPLQNDRADLVVGNRLGKQLSRRAMPFLHRYIGTPVLSFLIRFLYGIEVYDCNGGLRAFKREKYAELGLKQPGMEYASEFLIASARCHWRYCEVPVTLRPAHRAHTPHVRTWRDGLRHLKIILCKRIEGINGWKNAGLLVFFALLCGLYGLTWGIDANWDLLNYHLYNPYAFMTGRMGTDVLAAGGMHTFFNPLLDIPLYLAVKYLNHYPHLAVFLLSAPGGVFLFFLYKLSRLVFPGRAGRPFAWLAVCLGGTGSMFLSQVGLCSGEVTVAALLAASCYLFVRFLSGGRRNGALLFLTALVSGAAVGLKMTCAPWVAGMSVVFLINLYGAYKPARLLGWYALGGVLGFLLTGGYFAARLWILYANPVFPFFNGFFRSPYFVAENWKDMRFFPKTTGQWIFYPFYWMREKQHMSTEIATADPRLALGYISAVLLAMGACFKRTWQEERRLVYALAGAAVVGYVLWLRVYSILRYTIILEGVSAILVLWLLRRFTRAWLAVCLGVLVAWSACWVTVAPDWGHVAFGKEKALIDFSPQIPALKPRALVVFFGQPMSFLAPFLPPDARFVGGVTFPVEKYPFFVQNLARQRNSLPASYYGYRFDAQIKQTIARHEGPVYIIAVPWSMMLHPITLEPYGLRYANGSCIFFNANINRYSRGWKLCEVEQIGRT